MPGDQHDIWGGRPANNAPGSASSSFNAAPTVISDTDDAVEDSEQSQFEHNPAGYDGSTAWEQEEAWLNEGHTNSDGEDPCLESTPVSLGDSVLPCNNAASVGLRGQSMPASTHNARAPFPSDARLEPGRSNAASASPVPMEILHMAGGFTDEMTSVLLDTLINSGALDKSTGPHVKKARFAKVLSDVLDVTPEGCVRPNHAAILKKWQGLKQKFRRV